MLLETEGLRAGYGRLEILHGIDFHLDDGQFLGILGPNGAGKTTLLRALSGTIRPMSGDIQLFGRHVGGWNASRRARVGLAYVPQEANVFDQLSVRENLRLSHARGDRSLLNAVFDRFPFLADRAEQPAGVLSGGERQTLAVVMAAICEPRLLLLDEPTAGLSPMTAAALAEWILELGREGIAIAWVVEQNPELVLKAADHAYLLDAGSLRFEGTGEELLARDGVKMLFEMEGTLSQGGSAE